MIDYISRQDAIEAIFGRSHEIIKMRIEKLPSARKKGEWIDKETKTNDPFWAKYECSECGKRSFKSDFCPYCGTEMRSKCEVNAK